MGGTERRQRKRGRSGRRRRKIGKERIRGVETDWVPRMTTTMLRCG
jgi:hypothetical protein